MVSSTHTHTHAPRTHAHTHTHTHIDTHMRARILNVESWKEKGGKGTKTDNRKNVRSRKQGHLSAREEVD